MVAINTPAAMRRRLQSRKKSRLLRWLERLETPWAVKLRQQRRADGNRRNRLDPAGPERPSSLSKAGGEAPDTELTLLR